MFCRFIKRFCCKEPDVTEDTMSPSAVIAWRKEQIATFQKKIKTINWDINYHTGKLQELRLEMATYKNIIKNLEAENAN